MLLYDSLTHILVDTRDKPRNIRFIDGAKDESRISFADLWDDAVSFLGHLQNRGMGRGDELIIFTKSNRKFLTAFWAAVLGGMVPVPVAVGISDEHRVKLFRIMRQLQRATIYSDHEQLKNLMDYARPRDFVGIMEKLESRSVIDEEIGAGQAGDVIEPNPDDTALIQYSSGSTSDPKGVCLTHVNLTTNIRAIIESLAWDPNDKSLSWMPLTHDMGLIGFHLSVLAAGMSHALMDTGVFVRRPLLWMTRASELKATQLCSPNFGYKHFLKALQRKGLDDHDLSSVRLILNGAEPISWDLCEEFLHALAPFGLKRTAMFPVYGLAEATVAVTIPTPGQEYSRIVVDRHDLRVGEPYRKLQYGDADAVSFVKVGRAIRDCEIRIVDDDGNILDEELVGHIQVKGASVTKGLYDGNEAGDGLFTGDHWLRTGDCGALVDGELVITGRAKDIIIVNGQNYYPHDLEEIIANLDELDLGKVVVCGVSPVRNQTEELLVFVIFRHDIESFRPLARAVHDIIGTHAGLEVNHVIPVTRIPKTTSGKLQRNKLADAYLDGEFDATVGALSEVAGGADGLDDDPLVRELELICREFSKERRIGPDDNLFEVGVSSLTLTEIVLAIDERYPGKIDISDLFDHPTIRELASFIRR